MSWRTQGPDFEAVAVLAPESPDAGWSRPATSDVSLYEPEVSAGSDRSDIPFGAATVELVKVEKKATSISPGAAVAAAGAVIWDPDLEHAPAVSRPASPGQTSPRLPSPPAAATRRSHMDARTRSDERDDSRRGTIPGPTPCQQSRFGAR